LFGHTARADHASHDHSRALRVGQPSTILQPSGVAKPVDLRGLSFGQSNWTSASPSSASILRGNEQRQKVMKGMPPDDDDDDDDDQSINQSINQEFLKWPK